MGYASTQTKAYATRQAIENGAQEIDIVLNLGALFGGEYQFVEDEIAAVVDTAQGRTVKVILETGYYQDMDRIKTACQIVEAARGKFVKTNLGFAPSPYTNQFGRTVGYTVEILRLIHNSVSVEVGVKAAQDVRRLKDALDVIEIGVTRFGVSRTESLFKEFDQMFS